MRHSGDVGQAASGRRRRVAMVAMAGVFVLVLTGCFGDGRFYVGNGRGEVPTGTYTTAGAAGCEWAFIWGFGSPLTHGAQGSTPSAAERQIVTIPAESASSGVMTSDGCGIWFPITASTPALSGPPTADKPSGMYRVPTDMAHGYWRAPGGTHCRQQRIGDFTDFSLYFPAPHTDGQQTVHLGTRWHGFRTSRCGTWHRIG